MHLTTPQALSMFRLIWDPNSTGFELLRAQDHVSGAVLDAVSGHVSKLEVVRSSEDALNCPLGQLAGVILQLGGQTGSSLRVQLLSPVNVSSVSGVPLVESFQVDELRLVV